nr:SUN domain-containing protein 3-like isoform X2 [Maniola hyperantus]
MVMVTRSYSRRESESFSSDISEKNIIPPWCSTVTYLTSDTISQADLLAKILPKSNFVSFLSIDSTSVDEECCHRMRHLALELRRAEEALSKALRGRNTVLISQHLDTGIGTQHAESNNKGYIKGARAFRGSDTVEWGAQASLWGVVPLWRAAPRPDIILSSRRPVPSDCWPFRGSYGEVIIDLARNSQVDFISLEHIRPDTAYSAPKNFTVYGILANGTWIKAADAMYQYNKAAKQYYHLDNRNSPLQQLVFRVLSNQGNPNYTCIYRIHLYSSL